MELPPKVKNILLLDSEGKRIAAKYYSGDWPTNTAKEAFEKAVFSKTQKANARTEGFCRLGINWVRLSVGWTGELPPKVKNILLLDSEGKRIAAKYYSGDWPTNTAKEAFEKAVFSKTQKTNARTEVNYKT
ncbi:hypothetical protein F2Q68_00019749 [Brassica cretica]|uniref:Coatomer subunit zeta n=1 Tax=Brassica cretica TaxID=69181 RepID=A0A8S9FXX0_BRACR|nr:hypothetical protein F2Q68_00019749 [Brassica cretica]